LLDSTGRLACFASGSGIDAVALANGELLWSTKEAQVPLLVIGDRLYALALSDRNVLHVRGFDLGNRGKRIYQSAPVEFPAWVVTGEAPGRSFQFTGRKYKTILILNWQSGAWAESGPRKQAAGEARIDLENGTVKLGPLGSPALPPAVPVPAPLVDLSVRWQRSISGHLHALVLEEVPAAKGERKQRLVLRTWNEQTGKEGSARELLSGSRPVVLADPSRLHLWLRDAAPSPDELGTNDAPGRRYGWTIWSVLDGHLVARVPFLPGTQQATLMGERAYCLVAAPLRGEAGNLTRRGYTLYAIDVGSGKTLWQRTLSNKALVP
jgi:hypothetical protein